MGRPRNIEPREVTEKLEKVYLSEFDDSIDSVILMLEGFKEKYAEKGFYNLYLEPEYGYGDGYTMIKVRGTRLENPKEIEKRLEKEKKEREKKKAKKLAKEKEEREELSRLYKKYGTPEENRS